MHGVATRIKSRLAVSPAVNQPCLSLQGMNFHPPSDESFRMAQPENSFLFLYSVKNRLRVSLLQKSGFAKSSVFRG